MKQILTISDKGFRASICNVGAELISLTKDKEYIWQRDPDVWARSAPVLFPVCGRLKDQCYTYEGKSYSLDIHGFSKDSEYETEAQTDNSVCLVLKSSPETKKSYPFDFEFRVRFVLNAPVLDIFYEVKNLTDGRIYFSVGAHEGYACPEGCESYTVEFEDDDMLTRTMLEGGFENGKEEQISLENKKLKLDYDEFEKCTYVFKNLRSRRVILRDNKNTRAVAVTFNGFDTLALWTLTDRKYLCIEPWCGCPEGLDTTGNITQKERIIRLEKNERISKKHSIEIIR